MEKKSSIVPIDLGVLAYVIGLAIGDGNLSNPNGRAIRLRITCHVRYQSLIQSISQTIQALLPKNKVSIIKRSKNYLDISCYSNQWENWLGWSAGKGSKFKQNVSIPGWILEKEEFLIPCLKGLIETDGSIYRDRGYLMINFVTTIEQLASDVMTMLFKLGFKASISSFASKNEKHRLKHTIRICQNAEKLIEVLGLSKA